MASEQFSLCWDNFHKNMTSEMNQLLEDEDLVDVTLAVEGRYLKAHKMVLSVCSPYFKELFKVNPCKHPIVFMKDVSYVAMSDLLQFMYQGEVQVSQENLTTFIKTAEALQVKGLTGDGNGAVESEENDHLMDEEAGTSSSPIPHKLTKIKTLQEPVSTPPLKRKRVSAPSTSKIQLPYPVPSGTSATTEELIQFKMEPHDQNPIDISAVEVEDFADESLDPKFEESAGDFSVMEGADMQPKPGTSTEADGTCTEGQDDDKSSWAPKKKLKKTRRKPLRVTIRTSNLPRYFLDGYVYHQDAISESVRYLRCGRRTLGCKGRAIMPIDGTGEQIKEMDYHNHPPDLNAKEKFDFLSELQEFSGKIGKNKKMPGSKIYESVAKSYPKAAKEIPFTSICTSIYRWRNNPRNRTTNILRKVRKAKE